MRATVVFWLTCGCLLASGAAWGGTVTGDVRYTGQNVQKKKVKVTIDKYICGELKDDETLILSPDKGIRNAVVSLDLGSKPIKAGQPLPMEVEIDQKKCVFLPHVVVVPEGGTVKFRTSDRLLHNIHSKSKSNRPFNRAQPKGRTVSIKFTKPEIIRVDCDLHSWMHAWVVVADHPFYAITDDQGHFVLNDVPPGQYTLRIWHERLGTITKKVSVTDDGSTPLELEMSGQ